MRTTLNLDSDLMERVAQRFPPGTPKTVILEEGLRRLLAEPERAPAPGLAREIAALVARGVLTPARRTGVPPQGPPALLAPGQLLRDLASDREDR